MVVVEQGIVVLPAVAADRQPDATAMALPAVAAKPEHVSLDTAVVTTGRTDAIDEAMSVSLVTAAMRTDTTKDCAPCLQKRHQPMAALAGENDGGEVKPTTTTIGIKSWPTICLAGWYRAAVVDRGALHSASITSPMRTIPDMLMPATDKSTEHTGMAHT